MKTWTESDVQILTMRAHEGIDVLCKILCRAPTALFTKASKLGIKISRVLDYDRNGSELENKKWVWENRIKNELVANGECLEWHKANSKGYGQVRIFVDGVKRIFSTHRIAREVTDGALIPDGLSILHKCDNPKCNNPSHLIIGTAQDNTNDMHAKSRGRGMFQAGHVQHENLPRGIASVNAKMDDLCVTECRVLYDAGLIGYKLLAKKYSVSPGVVWRIIKRRGWRHIQEPSEQKRREILCAYLSVNPNKPKRTGKSISVV